MPTRRLCAEEPNASQEIVTLGAEATWRRLDLTEPKTAALLTVSIPFAVLTEPLIVAIKILRKLDFAAQYVLGFWPIVLLYGT